MEVDGITLYPELIKELFDFDINKSIDLLKKDELRISDIAYQLGFESLTTFTRVFKQQTGKSPSAFHLNSFE